MATPRKGKAKVKVTASGKKSRMGKLERPRMVSREYGPEPVKVMPIVRVPLVR